MKMMRILSGGIQQESHSFNSIVAQRSDFQIIDLDHAVEAYKSGPQAGKKLIIQFTSES